MNVRRVVVGSADHEMNAIEVLARGLGLKVAWATTPGGKNRVWSGVSYQAAQPKPLPGDVWVECRPTGFCKSDLQKLGAVAIDHHCPGDAGFGAAPENFLRGSSLGQFLQALARAGINPFPEEDIVWHPRGAGLAIGLFWFDGERWWLAMNGLSVAIPLEVILIAAADHCLSRAYAAQCPGVDPEVLWQFRLEQVATTSGRSADELQWDWEDSLQAVLSSPLLQLGNTRVFDARGVWNSGGELAARKGVAFLFSASSGPVLKGDPSGEAVEEFVKWASAQGWPVYGCPERGFAGAIVNAA